MTVVERAVRHLRDAAWNPGWQLVVGGLVLALAFPSRLAGSIGLAVVAGGCAIGIARLWPHLPDVVRAPGPRLATVFAVTLIAGLGLSIFWSTLVETPDWLMGDWGPQHAVLARVMPSLPGLDAPVWNHAVGTGDAPLELYPKLAYLVVGHVALLLGLRDDPLHALLIVAVLVHVGLAVTTLLVAIRIGAPRPLAVVVALVMLIDSGAVAHGGTVGLFRYALLHSAMSLLFLTLAVLAVLAALDRPRLRASIAIWVFTALACATHPAGLIAAVATCAALLATALLADDRPPRRAAIALGHVALGVVLGAFVWMPLAERLLDYGQHFPNALRSPSRLLEDLLHAPSPVTSYTMIEYAGYFGILAGLWSRRAHVVLVSALALVLIVGLCDAPYLALDLAPGQGVARLGTERLAQLARPFVAAAAAYGMAIFAGQAIAAWRGASPRRKTIAIAVIGVLAGAAVREVGPVWRSGTSRAVADAHWVAGDRAGRMQLETWAIDQARALGPDRWARAMFELDTHEHFHLTARTGLPTLHLGPQPDLLLRERIEDATPESLQRFDVRWVIGVGRSPTFGDPASEIVLGSFHVRTVPGWDGKLARIERGEGDVTVTRLDDEAVEIDVHAKAPVLVALGTGYYPRWRAHHAGVELPVYAQRATPTATLSVVAAWVPPGKTTFTPDGPLPSDGKGTLPSALALVIGIAIVVVWRRRVWRVRALRWIARRRMAIPRRAELAWRIGVPAVLVVLLARGCSDATKPIQALELGNGLRANATVEARASSGAWVTCSYQRLAGTHVCDGLLTAYDGIVNVLNDATPSWAFNTAGIVASAEVPGVEMRVRWRERVAGTYWTATSGEPVTLEVSGEPQRTIDRAVITYADDGTRAIELRAPVPVSTWAFAFVRESTLMPPREFLAEPPIAPPDVVQAIH